MAVCSSQSFLSIEYTTAVIPWFFEPVKIYLFKGRMVTRRQQRRLSDGCKCFRAENEPSASYACVAMILDIFSPFKVENVEYGGFVWSYLLRPGIPLFHNTDEGETVKI
jgi:hypothetical protein